MARSRKIPAPSPEGMLDVEQTCHVLGVSRPTLYRYMKDADFPEAVKHLGKTWFSENALRQWAASRGAQLDVGVQSE